MAYKYPIPDNAVLMFKKVHLATADILDLNGTPITLVAAVGAGTTIFPAQAFIKYNAGSTGFTNANPLVIYTDTITTQLMQTTATVITGTSSKNSSFAGPAGTFAGNVKENSDLKIAVQTANPTTGNGSADVFVWYYVVTL